MAKKANTSSKKVLVVESPSKIKKIKEILKTLGSEYKDYEVAASYGHITELEKGSKGVDKKTFTPSFVVSAEKKDVVNTLKTFKKNGYEFILASDPDREGEKIAHSIAEVLNLPIETTTRITFNEITKKAVEEALNKPRTIDMNLVKSQESRRIIDRLVGFDLSGLLWKKVRPNLSAGRVQSVAVRLISEREREINGFDSDVDFKTTGTFLNNKNAVIKALLDKRFKDKETANNFLKQCINKSFSITSKEVKPGKKSPSPPFTTSTLQQAAGSRLGFAVDRTMKAAQKLYEGGHISYMRTDSVMLSEDAIKGITAEIKSRYGDKYLQNREFKNKNKNAQEAHEAIRPTHFENITAGADSDEQRLYELIWKRSMACQMADAVVENTNITIGTKGVKEEFVAKGQVMKFDGFTKAYNDAEDQKDDEDDENDSKALPAVEKGDILTFKDIVSAQSFTKPSPRFNEPGLVKKMEESGIGRPSTYATIIKTIQDRGYVEKKDIPAKERKIETLTLTSDGKISEVTKTDKFGGEKAKLVPTDIAGVVVDYLKKHFAEVMDYNFTAETEGKLDSIADGEKQWDVMLGEFYKPFTKLIKEAAGEEGKVGIKEIGQDPKTGKTIIARVGKFGPMIQLGEEDKEAGTKPKFAKLKEGQSIDTITLKEALKLLEWPRELGKHKGENVTVAIGKFGPYVKIGSIYASIPKEENAEEITLKRAIEIFDEKSAAKASKVIKEFKSKEIFVLNGQYGAYIKSKKGNHKIPAGKEASTLTLSECEEIIENSGTAKKSNKGKFKKK
jgi:DNA topoisomerase-1